MSRIDEALTYGYKFDMGKYMSTGWNTFTQGAGNYIGFTVLYFIIALVIAFIPFVNMLSSAIQYTLIAGIFIFTRNMLNGQETFSDFFNGFSSFAQIILFWLVLVVFMLPAIIIFIMYLLPEGLFEAMLSGDMDPMYWNEVFEEMFALERLSSIGFLYLILMLYIMYLYISYSFTLILIVDRGLGFWDAMEVSRKVIAKNFFYFFGMYIVLFLLFVVGATITCGLGLLVLLPYMYNVVFAAYDDIIGPEVDNLEDSEEDFLTSIKE